MNGRKAKALRRLAIAVSPKSQMLSAGDDGRNREYAKFSWQYIYTQFKSLYTRNKLPKFLLNKIA
jgi:hypothetical protein